jgi:RNA polymerase sigma-70 factor (ECF subfamily)
LNGQLLPAIHRLIGYDSFWFLPCVYQTTIVSEEIGEPDEGALLRRVGQGNREAFTELYDRLSGLVYSLAFRVLNDSKEAEDIIQDLFLQIWDKAGSYDPNLGKPISWILTLTRNKAIDRLRALHRRYRFLAEQPLDNPAAPPVSADSSGVFDQDRAILLRSAVRNLPFEQRQAIEMAFFGGMTQNEISESLQQPLGTIKARIRRGMLKLRDTLERLQ